MRFVHPGVYHIAQTTLDREGVDAFFVGYEVEDWDTDAPSDAERLIEIAGRRCYNSFATEKHPAGEKNPNISKVREGNEKYIGHLHAVGHGSVIEHASDTYMLHNVSRVLTHELVRHRVGTAFSQESLRYVRLTDIGMWFPKCFADHPKWRELKQVLRSVMLFSEEKYDQLGNILEIGKMRDFNQKKLYTSAMRRIMPIGLSTGICVTANHRTWRHTIAMRTNRAAEEEIRLVWSYIAEDLASRYPSLYQDMQKKIVGGLPEYTFGREEETCQKKKLSSNSLVTRLKQLLKSAVPLLPWRS